MSHKPILLAESEAYMLNLRLTGGSLGVAGPSNPQLKQHPQVHLPKDVSWMACQNVFG